MRFCPYCGKQLQPGEDCGCTTEHGSAAASAGAPNKNKAQGKKYPKFLIPAAVLIAALIAVIGVVSNLGATLDLKDYIQIEEVRGLNGQGVLIYSLDEAALTEAMIDEAKSEEFTEENWEELLAESFEEYEEVEQALDCIVIDASQDSGLSNGDTITLIASFQNAQGHKFTHRFKDGSVEYTVSGLAEGKSLDPFANGVVTLHFSGFTGSGEAELEIVAPDDIYDRLRYTVSPMDGLANGDEVVVTAAYEAKQLEELGYFAPEKTERSYIVEGLQEYFDISKGIPQEAMKEMEDQLLEYMQAASEESARGSYFSITQQPEILGAYFLTTGSSGEVIRNIRHGLTMQNAAFILGRYTVEYSGTPHVVMDNWCVYAAPNCSEDSGNNFTYEKEAAKCLNLGSFVSTEDFELWMEEEFPEMEIIDLPD